MPYRKLGINSKAELFLLFGAESSPDIVPAEPAGENAAPGVVVDVQKVRELLTISKL